MTLFEWDAKKYGVGVRKFDQHHERLVELINELHGAMKSGEGKDRLGEIVEEMKDYTAYHFAAEEKLMDRYGYDGLDDQRIQHEKFVDRVSEFEQDLKSGKITLTMEVMNFLKDWLTSHIQKSDAKYEEFFHDKGVT